MTDLDRDALAKAAEGIRDYWNNTPRGAVKLEAAAEAAIRTYLRETHLVDPREVVEALNNGGWSRIGPGPFIEQRFGLREGKP